MPSDEQPKTAYAGLIAHKGHEVLSYDPETRTTLIKTAVCVHCGKRGELRVDTNQYLMWVTSDLAIQDAMPATAEGDREQLMTGTHDKCWDELWAHD